MRQDMKVTTLADIIFEALHMSDVSVDFIDSRLLFLQHVLRERLGQNVAGLVPVDATSAVIT